MRALMPPVQTLVTERSSVDRRCKELSAQLGTAQTVKGELSGWVGGQVMVLVLVW